VTTAGISERATQRPRDTRKLGNELPRVRQVALSYLACHAVTQSVSQRRHSWATSIVAPCRAGLVGLVDGEQMDTFEAFLDAELDGLRRYAQLLAGNRHDAHDLLADTLVNAQIHWDKVGAATRPGAYVRKMLTNGHISQARRWSIRTIRPSDPASLPERTGPDPTTWVDDLDELHRLLTGLVPQQRAAVVLRYYLQVPDEEIGRELGCRRNIKATQTSDAASSRWSPRPPR